MLTITLPAGADRGVCRINQRMAEYRVTAHHLSYRFLDEATYGHWNRRLVVEVQPTMATHWSNPEGPAEPANTYICA